MLEKFDIVIAGSGFAGSVSALALRNSGFRVCLVEKESHPRFAIGESSTPVADMALRSLADSYDLPYLHKLSRYGSWQENLPDLLCGIKRGFSYFSHQPGDHFYSDENHSHELLVAASTSDNNSDTNWYRPDIDAFLAQKVKDAGITFLDRTEITGACYDKGLLLTLNGSMNRSNHPTLLHCKLLVDATGSPGMASQLFDIESSDENFETNTFALYSHFSGVQRWSNHIKHLGYEMRDYPYDPDHSALHHLIEEGWMWNLRFNNELVSAGVVIDSTPEYRAFFNADKVLAWKYILSRYPSLNACFESSEIFRIPGEMKLSGRMQRRMKRVYGRNWVALNHTAGFVDPLHSTGIAHTLCGLERLLMIICKSWGNKEDLEKMLARHQGIIFTEFALIDLLVAGCFKSRRYFELFHAFTMLYFTCTISYEQQRLAGNNPEYYLQAGDSRIQRIVKQSYQELMVLLNGESPGKNVDAFIDKMRKRIEPYNTAGLLDMGKQNMYHHTAVKL